MSAEDAFTSVQWDRGESQGQSVAVGAILEESPSPPGGLKPAAEEINESGTAEESASKNVAETVHNEAEQQGQGEEAYGYSAPPAYHREEEYTEEYTQEFANTYKDDELNDASRSTKEVDPKGGVAGNATGLKGESQQGDTHEGEVRRDSEEANPGVYRTLNEILDTGNLSEEDALMNMRRMEEQFAKYKIELVVSNPIFDKDPNGKLFISYLIETTTDHPDIRKLLQGADKVGTKTDNGSKFLSIKVRRRYRDFRFLSACLTNDFPLLMVPPLPPKLNFKYLTGDTFSKSFVHKRLSSLARFVAFICEHKILSQLAVFHYFLSDSAEWGTFTKNLKIAKNGSATGVENDGEPLFVGKVVNEELLTETVMNFFTSSKHKRETNKEILEISDKLKKLYENLIKLDKIFARLNKKNNDLRSDYELFLTQVSRLAAIQILTVRANDAGNVDPNASFTTGASFDGTLSYAANCKVVSESLLYFLSRWGDLHQYIDEQFLVSLKDCAKYIIKFSDLIELQHNKKIDLQVLQDYLGKARTELVGLGGASGGSFGGSNHHLAPSPALINHNRGGLVNNTTQLIKDTLSTSATPTIGSTQSDLKRVKLEQRIASLEREIVAQTKVVNAVTSQIINEEYPNWDRYNKKQLKQSMMELCDQEISFYRDLLENWQGVEQKLVLRLEELA